MFLRLLICQRVKHDSLSKRKCGLLRLCDLETFDGTNIFNNVGKCRAQNLKQLSTKSRIYCGGKHENTTVLLLEYDRYGCLLHKIHFSTLTVHELSNRIEFGIQRC